MLIKTVRTQFWKKAAFSYVAIAAIVAVAFNANNNQVLLFALLPMAYLLWGTGSKCPNCHNKVQQIHAFFSIPWCPKACFTCGKNLSKR